jgi:type IX secretion system PorP/SprF family membrane protein
MKKLFTSLFIVIVSLTANAQQDVLLSQYMFNHLAINPGYAGNKNYMMATLVHRKQWVGWEGAPETSVASFHGRLYGKKLGIGATVMHDHIGVTSRNDVTAHFAYQLQINHYVQLGLGLQGGFSHFTYKNSDLLYWETNDRVFEQNTQTSLHPNFGTGAFLYSRKFYAGISVPHILNYVSENGNNIGGNIINTNQVRHYFMETGCAIEVNSDFVLKPSVLVKYVKGAPVQADINMNVLLASTIWIGGSYRSDAASVAMLELQLTPKLRVGYSYDFTMSHLNNYSSGSHEIMIGYDFGYDIVKMKTPRYF